MGQPLLFVDDLTRHITEECAKKKTFSSSGKKSYLKSLHGID